MNNGIYYLECLTNYFISISKREIIFLQIGQCGIQVGTEFLKTLCKDHNLDGNGRFSMDNNNEDMKRQKLDKIDAYFNEAGFMRFVPRFIQFDMEPGTDEIVRASPTGSLLKPDNSLYGYSGCGNN